MNNWKFDLTSYCIGAAIGVVATFVSMSITEAISKKRKDEIDKTIRDIEDDILITAVYDIGRTDGMASMGNDIAKCIADEGLGDATKEVIEKGEQIKKDARESWGKLLNENQKEALDRCRNR